MKNIYNNFYSKELWEKVNEDNKAILSDYLLELKQNKKSSGTLYQYEHDLKICFIYILKYLDNKMLLL